MADKKAITQLHPEVNNHKDLEYMFKQLVEHQNIRLYSNHINACLFLVKQDKYINNVWEFKTTVFHKSQSKYVVNQLGFQGMNYKGVNYKCTLNVAIKTIYSSN